MADALLRGTAWPLTMNDLLTGVPKGDRSQAKQQLATTLTEYARRNPDSIGGRLSPVIVYDPHAGLQHFSMTLKKLRA